MIGFALSVLLVTLPVATVGADNAASGKQKKEKTTESALGVKPVTGSWINLAYKDVRNKYTNPQSFDNMDPKLWEAKVRELSAMGIEYLVLMEVANEGKSYYPSQIMPWWYNKDKKSPVDAILDEAAKHNMKIFMSSGWAKDQDDNLLDPAIKERQLQIMEELASLYKNHKAFYGWYLPVEDCLCPIFAEHAVQSVNTLSEKAKKLAPGKKTLISPYGIGLSEFDNPEYEKQMQKLKVDISQTPEMKGVYSRVRLNSEISRKDMLLLALMSSENRAAASLAHHYPGGYKAFIKAMNAKAKSLGMNNTRFVEPTGLSVHNVSTARDLTKLLIASKQYPLIGQLSTTREDMATFSNPTYTLPFRNTNHLVYRDNWNIQLTKTGFTNAAGHCLVMRTVINNKPVALVVMDAFGKYTHFADASRLRTWIETGKVMPVPAAALSYKKQKAAQMAAAGQTAQND